VAVSKGKIFTISLAKGGVGKTTTLRNLAGIFELLDKKVLIIDLDLYGGGIALSLNLKNEKDIFHLFDDISNNRYENIHDYITKYDDHIEVLCAPNDPRLGSKINGKFVDIILTRLITQYDVILIDTNHILSEVNLVALDRSDTVLFVITNDPVDLKNMKSITSIFKDSEKDNYKIILNNSRDNGKDYFIVNCF